MPTASPVRSSPAVNIEKTVWTIATGDTVNPVMPQGAGAVLGRVQFAGDFGSGTFTLAGSNDGTTYVTLSDVFGAAISATAAGQFEFATAALYIKPVPSGGTADSVVVTMVTRA